MECHRECDVAASRHSISHPIRCARSPQTDHRLLLQVNPHKHDVACWIAIGEGKTDNFAVKLFRRFRVGDRKMSFVETHPGSTCGGPRFTLRVDALPRRIRTFYRLLRLWLSYVIRRRTAGLSRDRTCKSRQILPAV